MVSGKHTILIMTSDHGFTQSVVKLLDEYGYATMVAHDEAGGLAAARRVTPSLILVDNSLVPLQILRKEPSLRRVPVITLYPQGTDCQEVCVEVLEQGADASLCTPISTKELVARIRAILRRDAFRRESKGLFVVGGLRIDLARHEVTVNSKSVDLTLKEFQILQQLAQRPGWVFRRDELLDLVWGEGAALEEHNLDVHVHSLRRKIEADPTHPRMIMTIRGIGYKLRSEP
jgi:DNA-binding response OmpR family regulator